MNFLTKNIFGFNSEPFALDISDTSIKALQLVGTENSCKIRSIGLARMVPGSIEGGAVLKEENVAFAIQSALTSAWPKKITSKEVICSLPESKVFSRIISIPKMSEEEASEAIKWELEANIPLSIDEVYFDWHFLDTEKNEKQKVLAVAISKEIVDNLIRVLESAGLHAVAFEPESISAIRSLVENKKQKQESHLVIDIGSSRTSIIITEGNLPIFSSSATFSSEGVTDIISKHFGIGKQEAEAMKIQQTNTKYDETNSILNIAESLLENLVSGVEKSVDFCFNGEKNASDFGSIILTGGGSNLRGLNVYLEKRLGMKVSIGNPFINLKFKRGSVKINQETALEFATACGLAMRNLYDDKI